MVIAPFEGQALLALCSGRSRVILTVTSTVVHCGRAFSMHAERAIRGACLHGSINPRGGEVNLYLNT
jgi:hypothetical protein